MKLLFHSRMNLLHSEQSLNVKRPRRLNSHRKWLTKKLLKKLKKNASNRKLRPRQKKKKLNNSSKLKEENRLWRIRKFISQLFKQSHHSYNSSGRLSKRMSMKLMMLEFQPITNQLLHQLLHQLPHQLPHQFPRQSLSQFKNLLLPIWWLQLIQLRKTQQEQLRLSQT